MFASYLAYQLIDFALAILLVVGAQTLASATLRPFGVDAFRRFVIGTVPLTVVLAAALAMLCTGPLQDFVWSWAQRRGIGPVSVSFLGVGVAFYAWLVLLPLRGLWLLARVGRTGTGRLRPLSIPRAAWAILGLAPLTVAVDAVCLEPFRLEVRELHLRSDRWPRHLAPLRIAVLADLQSPLFTRRESAVIDAVAELEADLIVLPGDLVAQSFRPELSVDSARRVVRTLEAPLGVFAVTGDVDSFVPGGLPRVLADTGAQLVDNVATEIADGVVLAGLFPPDGRAYRALLRQEGRADDDCFRIGVVHRPRHGAEISAHGFDLVIAGHTHGGQIVVPGFGPPVTASPLPRDIAAGGLHPLDTGGWLCISRGIGLEAGFAPPIRFLCRPEILVLTVESAEGSSLTTH